MNSLVLAEAAALCLPAPATSYRVLLIEDNPGDADIARELLASTPGLPLQLDVAVSLAQAGQCLGAAVYEAIVTDLNLPDAQGLDTLRQLRRMVGDLPIVVLASEVDEALRQRAMAEGAEEVFTKREANSRLFCRSVLFEVERNRARAQHRRLEGLLDATPDAILVVNQAGIVQYVNQAAVALFGRSREELRGDCLGFSAACGEAVEILVPRPGDPRVCEMRVVPLEWDGKPAQVASIRDITVRRQAEDLRARSDELALQNERISKATRLKSQFLANMSHEIRTPMNAILGMLTLLRRTDLDGRQADYAAKIEGAARALLGLLNDILDYSKVEAGRMAPDPHPFRIDTLLRDLSVVLSANVGDKPVELLFDIDPALPQTLVGDAMRLQQVLVNLGGNAIKFTAAGEVVLSVAVPHRNAAEVQLQVSVRDTGIGIAPENQERIFSGFTQAEASTTRRFGGTGLGLAISQRLVAMMGGELRVDSALGKGSCFHFSLRLPVAPDDAAVPPALPGPPAAMRALVVDDNATAREVLQRMGRSMGWSVDLADSGEQALRAMQRAADDERPYQAVFVDWQMPGMDGWETSRRIRARQLAGSTPLLVMVTAHGREMLSQCSEAEQSMIDGFLVKPVTASMLFDAVVDACAEREPTRKPSLKPARLAGAGQAGLAGMRLLVVEDNANNQQVARELLEDEGAVVQIAGNGQEAVEAVDTAAPPFDAVLMDLQMPVMDGFTATRRIRRDLGQTGLPIVAMTANAMASDRDACLAAGMNDHVGKPFDLHHLIQVLRRHVGRPPEADGPAQARQAVPLQAAAPAPDRRLPPDALFAAQAAGVDLPAALQRLGEHLGTYRRMLGRFIDESSADPSPLQAAWDRGGPAEAGRWLHTLRGVAGTLGAVELAREAGLAEKILAPRTAELAGPGEAQRADPGIDVDARQALDQARAALSAALPRLAALHQALADPPASQPSLPGVHGVAATREALRGLAVLLQNGDMSAMEALAALERDHGVALGDRLAPLAESVLDLDFARALACCHALTEECAA
ncbi:MAG: response regulator [Rubrivivax sp.]|nr:response regulator [Rubrivivax sp.]